MLIKTPWERSCIVCCMAWEIDRLKDNKYSSSSTACCVLSAALPLALSTRSIFKCVTMESCTFVKHLDRPAAWLHITDCSRNALSQRLKVSWLIVRDVGAESKLRLATLLKLLFNFAGSGDQLHTVVEAVVLVYVHVVPLWWPGWLDKLVMQQSTSLSVSRRVAFSNSQVQSLKFSTQPLIHR